MDGGIGLPDRHSYIETCTRQPGFAPRTPRPRRRRSPPSARPAGRRRGLDEVVDTRAAAADRLLGRFGQLEPGIERSTRAERRDALRVSRVTGVL
jgi:hypothetical protein